MLANHCESRDSQNTGIDAKTPTKPIRPAVICEIKNFGLKITLLFEEGIGFFFSSPFSGLDFESIIA